MKIKEAQETKKAIKLIARKGVDLSTLMSYKQYID